MDPFTPPQAPGDGVGGLNELATAISAYLEDVDDDWRVCAEHEGVASARIIRGVLCLTRQFPWSPAAARAATEASCRLPDWAESPFWVSDGADWQALEAEVVRQGRREPGAVTCFLRGRSWGGRGVLLRATRLKAGPWLRIEVYLLPIRRDLAELPLRLVAQGLCCHAALVPGKRLRPFPLPSPLPSGTWTVRGYLKRAMPKNLYASQCVSSPGEGTSPPSAGHLLR